MRPTSLRRRWPRSAPPPRRTNQLVELVELRRAQHDEHPDVHGRRRRSSPTDDPGQRPRSRSCRRPTRATTHDHLGHQQRGEHPCAPRLATIAADREAGHLVAEHLQRPAPRRRGRRWRTPGRGRAPRSGRTRTTASDDVDHVLDDVDDERRARVVVGVEAAQREQVDGEADEPDGEAAEGARRVERVRRGELAVLRGRRRRSGGAARTSAARREGEQGDEADAERR